MSIKQKLTTSGGAKLVTRAESVHVVFTQNGKSTEVVFRGDKATVNGKVTSSYSQNGLTLRRATSLFITLSGPGFTVDYDSNGRIYMRLGPEYGGKVGESLYLDNLDNHSSIKESHDTVKDFC